MKNTNAKGTSYARKVEKIAEQNARRIAEQSKKIAERADTDSIINTYAREIMREYYKGGDCGDKLLQLATIITHSKLNNLIAGQKRYTEDGVKFADTSNFVFIRGLKADIERHKLEKIEGYASEISAYYTGEYNADGDYEIICTNKTQVQEICKRMFASVALDGADLVQECCLYLWEQVCKADTAKADENHLLNIFNKYITSSKVYKSGEAKPSELWKQTATSPIAEAFAVVGGAVEAQRAPREQEVLYTSLFTSVTDPYTGETEEICVYRKANGISAEPSYDFNGKVFSVTANDETEAFLHEVPKLAKLTNREAYIYYKHYIGNKNNNYAKQSLQEVADTLKVRLCVIEKQNTSLKNKIAALYADKIIGYTPQTNAEKQKTVTAYNFDTGEKMFVFASIGEAAKILNISKSKVSEVLNGKRKQTSGYIFK